MWLWLKHQIQMAKKVIFSLFSYFAMCLLLNRFPVTASAESPESFNNFGGSNVPLGKRVRILKYRVHQMCMNLTAGRLNKMTPLAASNSWKHCFCSAVTVNAIKAPCNNSLVEPFEHNQDQLLKDISKCSMSSVCCLAQHAHANAAFLIRDAPGHYRNTVSSIPALSCSSSKYSGCRKPSHPKCGG